MGKEFAERRVATGETASQTRALPDLRSLRAAPASGVASGRNHGRECRESLSDQASGGGAGEARSSAIGEDNDLAIKREGPACCGPRIPVRWFGEAPIRSGNSNQGRQHAGPPNSCSHVGGKNPLRLVSGGV